MCTWGVLTHLQCVMGGFVLRVKHNLSLLPILPAMAGLLNPDTTIASKQIVNIPIGIVLMADLICSTPYPVSDY